MMTRRRTRKWAATKSVTPGYLHEDSWTDYSDGQGVTYSTHEADPIPLGIVKLERDPDLSADGPYELYVVVQVKARNAWGDVTRFEILRWAEQKSPYRLEDAQWFYDRLVQGGRLST